MNKALKGGTVLEDSAAERFDERFRIHRDNTLPEITRKIRMLRDRARKPSRMIDLF